MIRFLVFTYRAESGKTFFKKVSFNRINTLDYNVESDIKFFALDKQWVLNVSLHQEFVLVRISRQVMELFYQRNTFASPTSRRFTYKALIWEMPHVLFQVFDLIRKEE